MLVAQAAIAAEKFVGEKVTVQKVDWVYKSIVKAKQNLVLIGMPSSGKSTIGEQLANLLGMRFIDVDKEIEKTQRKSIPDIFKESGENVFRDIESQVIADIASMQNVVIATGGGAVLREQNVMLLGGNGKIYFVDRPLELLVTTDDRPLSSNRDDLVKRYEERYETYCRVADKKIINDGEIETVVNSIKEDFLT